MGFWDFLEKRPLEYLGILGLFGTVSRNMFFLVDWVFCGWALEKSPILTILESFAPPVVEMLVLQPRSRKCPEPENQALLLIKAASMPESPYILLDIEATSLFTMRD